MSGVTTWTREFRRPRLVYVKAADKSLFLFVPNRYGGLDDGSLSWRRPLGKDGSVLIGAAVYVKGHGLSLVWARPVSHTRRTP